MFELQQSQALSIIKSRIVLQESAPYVAFGAYENFTNKGVKNKDATQD
jgi:hypothetical protein